MAASGRLAAPQRGLLPLGGPHPVADVLVVGRLGCLGGRTTTAGPTTGAGQLLFRLAGLVVETLDGADGVAQRVRLTRAEAVERAQAQGLQHVLRQDAGFSEAGLQSRLSSGLQGARVVLVEGVATSERLAGGERLAVAVGQPLIRVGDVQLEERGALLRKELGVGRVGLQGLRELRKTDQRTTPV